MTYVIIEEKQYLSTKEKLTKEQTVIIKSMITDNTYSITEIAEYLNAKVHTRNFDIEILEPLNIDIEEILNSLKQMFP